MCVEQREKDITGPGPCRLRILDDYALVISRNSVHTAADCACCPASSRAIPRRTARHLGYLALICHNSFEVIVNHVVSQHG